MEEDVDILAEKMTNGLILFLNFLKKYRQIVKDEIIQDEQRYNNQTTITYTFRKFNLECYIIDKKYFDDFCSAINFYELSEVLKSINEETKDKCKEILKKLLVEKRYNPDYKDIIIYAEEEKMKTIVKKFNNYSFVNKELLIDCMGIPEERLKSKKILLSKNENNTSLLNIDENYVITLNIIKKPANKENEEKKFEIKSENESKSKKKKKGMNNLYYVEDITKKIFILLFKQEELLQKKIQKEINDVYNFKNYFLINKEWLKKYKESFLYDNVIGKLDKDLRNDSYKKIKTELDDIVKNKIGQIKLNESGVENFLKDSSNMIAGTKLIKLNDQNKEFEEELETKDEEVDVDKSYNVPFEFEIINEDIYELLKKEEFLEKYKEEVENKICFQILLGKEQIIIKNKLNKQFEEKNVYSNELLFYEKTIDGENNDNNYKLQYILSYEKKVNFFKEIEIIIKNDLGKYLTSKNIKLGEYYTKVNILDEKSNVLGKIININIKQDLIEKVNIENKNNKIKNDENNDEEQNIKYRKINSNINFIHKKEDNIEINVIHFSQPNILDENNIKQNQDNIINYNQDLNINKNEIKNNEENIINLNNIKRENEKKEINKIFDRLIQEINIEDIIKNVIDNTNDRKTQSDLNISGLRAKEIEPKINGKDDNKIFIMDEDEYKKYREMFDFDEIKIFISKYKGEKKQKRFSLLEENKEIIKKFINCFEKGKLKLKEDIQLIEDYESCIEKIRNNKKFFFLNLTNVNYDKKGLKHHYHFQFKLNHYIYFQKSKKIVKVINRDKEYNLYNLEPYVEKQNKDDLIKSLLELVNNNKSEKINISKDIKKYYLINDKWIQSFQKQNQEYHIEERIQPKMENDGYGIPVEFGIICKEEKTINLIDDIKKTLDIKEEFVVYEMIVLKNPLGNIYICIIKGNIIYFYRLEKKKYNFYFLINYYTENIMKKEVKENLISTDIEYYINFMILKREIPYKLYDIDFQEIGELVIPKSKKKIKILDNYEKPFIKSINENDKIIQTILACLANIIEIKNYIPPKKEIIKDSFLFIFFQIIRIIWSYNQNYFEKYGKKHDEIFSILMPKIKEISPDKNINVFENLSFLIDGILLKLQKDLYKFQFHKDFIYDSNSYRDKVKLEQLNSGKTLFQELFFFNLEISQKIEGQDTKEYCMKYYIDFDIKEDDKKSVDLKSLFNNLNQEFILLDTKNKMTVKKKFISLPKYLIVIINTDINNKRFSMFLKKNVDIKEFCEDKLKKTKYELFSIIEKNSISYCKSPIDSKWYKYDLLSNIGELEKKSNKQPIKLFENIHQEITPNLIILKQTS